MLSKDWARQAADEIASHWKFGIGRDSYVTDEQRKVIGNNIYEIISRHCPFEQGVLYIPAADLEAVVRQACGQLEKITELVEKLQKPPIIEMRLDSRELAKVLAPKSG